ncbi:hypothetical protein J7413_15160 [Shimia sp. R10_1]|uniref:hypothetical protein n=1 Tax=Shimia sp. R10_1 TaxID=2821095 RepID=UPI001ADBE904|nr:hypothetical protein [Shimia sp. R10_1]MBO9474887.1 hypothetical protein [Shimia sp. R10_1]
MIRPPGAAIASIRKLYADLGRDEYGSDALAADYYLARVGMMAHHWARFDDAHKIGITHRVLLTEPERVLAQISERFSFSPKLENRYESPAASRKGGGGDPTVSGKYTRIQAITAAPKADPIDDLQISDRLRSDVVAAHENFVDLISAKEMAEDECVG